MDIKIFKKEKEKETRAEPDYIPWHFKAMNLYQRDKTQKIVILVLCCLLFFAVFGMFQNKSEVRTVIVRTDVDGEPFKIEEAKAWKNPPLAKKEIHRTLWNITKWWRIKYTDARNNKTQFQNVWRFLEKAAGNKLLKIISNGNLYPWIEKTITNEQQYNPLRDVGQFTTEIEFISVTELGDFIYQFRIKETAFNSAGRIKDEYIIIATYTIKQKQPQSVDGVHHNPFGIFITDVSATRERNIN